MPLNNYSKETLAAMEQYNRENPWMPEPQPIRKKAEPPPPSFMEDVGTSLELGVNDLARNLGQASRWIGEKTDYVPLQESGQALEDASYQKGIGLEARMNPNRGLIGQAVLGGARMLPTLGAAIPAAAAVAAGAGAVGAGAGVAALIEGSVANVATAIAMASNSAETLGHEIDARSPDEIAQLNPELWQSVLQKANGDPKAAKQLFNEHITGNLFYTDATINAAFGAVAPIGLSKVCKTLGTFVARKEGGKAAKLVQEFLENPETQDALGKNALAKINAQKVLDASKNGLATSEELIAAKNAVDSGIPALSKGEQLSQAALQDAQSVKPLRVAAEEIGKSAITGAGMMGASQIVQNQAYQQSLEPERPITQGLGKALALGAVMGTGTGLHPALSKTRETRAAIREPERLRNNFVEEEATAKDLSQNLENATLENYQQQYDQEAIQKPIEQQNVLNILKARREQLAQKSIDDAEIARAQQMASQGRLLPERGSPIITPAPIDTRLARAEQVLTENPSLGTNFEKPEATARKNKLGTWPTAAEREQIYRKRRIDEGMLLPESDLQIFTPKALLPPSNTALLKINEKKVELGRPLTAEEKVAIKQDAEILKAHQVVANVMNVKVHRGLLDYNQALAINKSFAHREIVKNKASPVSKKMFNEMTDKLVELGVDKPKALPEHNLVEPDKLVETGADKSVTPPEQSTVEREKKQALESPRTSDREASNTKTLTEAQNSIEDRTDTSSIKWKNSKGEEVSITPEISARYHPEIESEYGEGGHTADVYAIKKYKVQIDGKDYGTGTEELRNLDQATKAKYPGIGGGIGKIGIPEKQWAELHELIAEKTNREYQKNPEIVKFLEDRQNKKIADDKIILENKKEREDYAEIRSKVRGITEDGRPERASFALADKGATVKQHDFLSKNKDLHDEIVKDGGEIIVAKNIFDEALSEEHREILKRGLPANASRYDARSAQFGDTTFLFSDVIRDTNDARMAIYHEQFHRKMAQLSGEEQSLHVDTALKQSGLLTSREFREALAQRIEGATPKMTYEEIMKHLVGMDGLSKLKLVEESLAMMREKQMDQSLAGKIKRYWRSMLEAVHLKPSSKELKAIIEDVVTRTYETDIKKLDPKRDLTAEYHAKIAPASRQAAKLQAAGKTAEAAAMYKNVARLARGCAKLDDMVIELNDLIKELSSPDISLRNKRKAATTIVKAIEPDAGEQGASFALRKKKYVSLENTVTQDELQGRKTAKRSFANAVAEYAQSSYDTLRRFSPEVARIAEDSGFYLNKNRKKSLDSCANLFKALDKLGNKAAENEIGRYLYNGDTVKAIDFLAANGGDKLAAQKMVKDSAAVLLDIGTRLKALGINVNMLQDYFPRSVRDLDGLLNEIATAHLEKIEAARKAAGQTPMTAEEKAQEVANHTSPITRKLIDAEKAAGRKLTGAEQADITNKFLQNPGKSPSGNSNLKERRIDKIPPRFMKFYDSPQKSLMKYIEHNEALIAKTEMFSKLDPKKIGGLRAKLAKLNKDLADTTDVAKQDLIKKEIAETLALLNDDASLGAVVNKLAAEGKLKPQDVNLFKEALSAVHWKPESGIVANIKNVIYGLTLAQVKSGLRQMSDLAFSLVENGGRNTGKAVGIEIARWWSKKYKQDFPVTLDELGVENQIAMEVGKEGAIRPVLDTLLKYSLVSGMDKFGKETMMTAALLRAKRDLIAFDKNPNDIAAATRFHEGIKHAFGEGPMSVDFINELRTGKTGEASRLYAYHKLLEWFPVAQGTGAPVMIKGNAWTKMAYQFKSYPLKFLNMYKQQTFGKMDTAKIWLDQAKELQKSSDPKKQKEGAQLEAEGKQLITMAYHNFLRIPVAVLSSNIIMTAIINNLYGREGMDKYWSSAFSELVNLTGINRFTFATIAEGGMDKALGTFISPGITLANALIKDITDIEKNLVDGKDYDPTKARMLNSLPIIGAMAYWRAGRGKDIADEKRSKNPDYN